MYIPVSQIETNENSCSTLIFSKSCRIAVLHACAQVPQVTRGSCHQVQFPCMEESAGHLRFLVEWKQSQWKR